MKIITCNIRFSSMANDHGSRSWDFRKALCFETISKRSPDVIALQECHNDQLKDFNAFFGSDYACFHGNSYASEIFPENAIFYRRSCFETLGHGAWQLSETPHIPGTYGWGSECPRLVNWVLVKYRGKLCRLINTHFDHASQTAREMAAKLVNEDAAAWDAGMPQILTGDLNCDPSNAAIKALQQAGWQDTMPPELTFALTAHEFQGKECKADFGICGKGRMDYIFIRGNIRNQATELVDDCIGGVFPSDHFFVASELDF